MSLHSCMTRPAMLIFFLVLMLIPAFSERAAVAVDARTLTSSFPYPQQQNQGTDGTLRTLDGLGIICKCCRESMIDCTTSWTGSCPNKLQCLPWKFSWSCALLSSLLSSSSFICHLCVYLYVYKYIHCWDYLRFEAFLFKAMAADVTLGRCSISDTCSTLVMIGQLSRVTARGVQHDMFVIRRLGLNDGVSPFHFLEVSSIS